MVELLDRTHQAKISLLDKIENRHATSDVALGDRHDETKVGRRQLLAGPVSIGDLPAQFALTIVGNGLPLPCPVQLGDRLGRLSPDLDSLGQRHFLIGGEQRDLADLLEIHPNRVGGAAGSGHGHRGHSGRVLAAAQHSPVDHVGRAGVRRLLVEGNGVVGHELPDLGQQFRCELNSRHYCHDVIGIERTTRFGAQKQSLFVLLGEPGACRYCGLVVQILSSTGSPTQTSKSAMASACREGSLTSSRFSRSQVCSRNIAACSSGSTVADAA